MKQYKAYKYRIYPTKNQKTFLDKHFGAVRWVYNYAFAKKIEFYTKEKKTLSRFDIQKEIVLLKKQEKTFWLKEVNSQSLQSSLVNLDIAYTKFFKEKCGFPKFKSKKSKQSIQFPQLTKVNFELNKLYVMKFREGIKCKFSRTFNGKIKTTTISKNKTDKYFVSILVEEEIPEIVKLKPEIKTAIGIDLGIKSFLVTSNGDKFNNPTYLKKSLKKLKRQQQKLSRKKKGSNNRIKQRLKVAKVHEKVSNQRHDFLHKISRELVNDNQINTYCIEKLNIQDMLKNKNLAQYISDAGWYTFITYLKYKSEWAGKNVLQIGQFEPSSKTCSICGIINHNLKLKDREWICKCGTEHDRDINAAINIKNFAFDKQNMIGQVMTESNTLVETKV